MDELEQRINFCHTKGMEDEEDYERASKAVGAATGNKPKKSAATPAGKCFLFCFVLFFFKIVQLAVSLLYVIHRCEILSFFFLQSKRSQKVSTQRISTNLFANSEVLNKRSCYF